MTKEILMLAAIMLDDAADRASDRSCDDFTLPDLARPLALRIAAKMNEQMDPDDVLETADSVMRKNGTTSAVVMETLAELLREEASKA